MEAYPGPPFTYFFFFATVTFSRMDPEGKLIMGFRKASNSVAMQVQNPVSYHASIVDRIILMHKLLK